MEVNGSIWTYMSGDRETQMWLFRTALNAYHNFWKFRYNDQLRRWKLVRYIRICVVPNICLGGLLGFLDMTFVRS